MTLILNEKMLHQTEDGIETTLSLSSDCHSPAPTEEQETRECQQHQQESISADPMICLCWNHRLLCIFGMATGMLFTSISRIALQMLIVHEYYRDRRHQSDVDDSLGDVALYAILSILSNLGAILYAVICLGFVLILTTGRGNAGAQRFLLFLLRSKTVNNSLVGDIYEDGESESDDALSLNIRAAFVTTIYLKGGYHLGASFVCIVVDLLSGATLPSLLCLQMQ